MPRAKRMLADIDPNASVASKTYTKSTKRKAATQEAENTGHEEGTNAKRTRGVRSMKKEAASSAARHKVSGRTAAKRQSKYATKDNSKLQLLLVDRGRWTDGGREDWIERLERSSIDYNSFTAGELSDMLRRRHMKGAAQYSRDVKIERLKVNDDYDCETGNDSLLWIHIWALEGT